MLKEINFTRYIKCTLYASMAYMLLIVVLLFMHGVNLGIDFIGGISMDIQLPEKYNLSDIRGTLNDNNINGTVQTLQNNGYVISFKVLDSDLNTNEYVQSIQKILNENFDGNIIYNKLDYVGPQIGGELIYSSLMAVIFALLSMFIYLVVRFNFACAVGGIFALVHDVLCMMGFFSISGIEMTISSIAAILTIVGYSINDTVVVFDYIRISTNGKMQNSINEDVVNFSLHKVMKRTLLTSITTLFSIFALIIFSHNFLIDFVWGIVFGLICGTYSSLMIAPAVLLAISNGNKKSTDDKMIAAA